MVTLATHRPRNLDSARAAAFLYGDLGTSKAYVIGIAFALAGYASFWLIAAVSVLTIIIGFNYVILSLKYYPSGGGVYASLRMVKTLCAPRCFSFGGGLPRYSSSKRAFCLQLSRR